MIDYNSFLNKTVTSLKPSGIRKFFDIAQSMEEVISLGVGEPDFITPWHIRDAGVYSLEKGYTYYTSNSGLLELRREIGNYLLRRFALDYNPDNQVLVTVGGSEAIDLALRAIIEPGDQVIIPEPSFVCYSPLTAIAGGVAVPVKTTAENGFRLTAQQLKAAITDKTKLLILPYPCNPTGGIMEKADLEAVAAVVKEHNLLVLSDEIYAELTYSGQHVSIASLPGMQERTILVSGFSKAFAMTGWRLGYLCAPKELTVQMTKIHQYAIMCAPTTAQYAAVEAMKSGDADIDYMKADYDRRRRLIYEGLKKIGLDSFEPQGAFYIFPSIKSSGQNSLDFCTGLLKQQNLAVVPGDAFGDSGEGYVRICYCYSVDHLTQALERMERYLESIK